MKNQLISRNVTVNGHRTSLRLEQAMWEAFDEICECEGVNIHKLCTMIESVRHGSSRTSAVRAFIVTYFRMAATTGKTLRAGTVNKALSAFSAVN